MCVYALYFKFVVRWHYKSAFIYTTEKSLKYILKYTVKYKKIVKKDECLIFVEVHVANTRIAYLCLIGQFYVIYIYIDLLNWCSMVIIDYITKFVPSYVSLDTRVSISYIKIPFLVFNEAH
jgi:hypothetical protein